MAPRMLKDVAEVDDLSLLHVKLPLRYQATVTGKTIVALKRDEGDGALEETAVRGGDEVEKLHFNKDCYNYFPRALVSLHITIRY